MTSTPIPPVAASRSGSTLAYRVIAVVLGLVFLLYGIVKVLGSQFHYGHFVLDKDTVAGPMMVWCFFGYSEFYGRFIGVAEMVPGLLLLWPRTTTVGAALLFPVIFNITVMDYAFGFPGVKHAALLYTIGCAWLLYHDRAKFRSLLWSRERCEEARALVTQAEASAPAPAGQPKRTARWITVVILAPALLFLANMTMTAIDTGPQEVAKLRCMEEGYGAEQLELRWTRMRGQSGIGRRGRALFELAEQPGEFLVVDLVRPTGFHDWRATHFERTSEPPEGL